MSWNILKPLTIFQKSASNFKSIKNMLQTPGQRKEGESLNHNRKPPAELNHMVCKLLLHTTLHLDSKGGIIILDFQGVFTV